MLGIDNKEQLTGKYKKVKENPSVAHFLPSLILFLCISIRKKVTEVNDKIKTMHPTLHIIKIFHDYLIFLKFL